VHRGDGLHRQVRVNRFGAVAGEDREVVHLAREPRLHHQAGIGPQALRDQVLVNSRHGEERRNGDVVLVHQPVGDDQDVVARADGVDGTGAQGREACLDPLLAPGHRIGDVKLEALELAVGVALDVADLRHVLDGQDRLVGFQAQRRVDVVDVEQVRLGPDERHQRHHHLLADRVDRRVGDLAKSCLK
jgi:hypothetical protein